MATRSKSARVFSDPNPPNPASYAERFEQLAAQMSRTARAKRSERRALLLAMLFGDTAVILGAIVAWCYGYLPDAWGNQQVLLMGSLILPAYLLTAWHSGAFRLRMDAKNPVPIVEALSALLLGVAGLLLLIFLTKTRVLSRVVLVGVIVTGIIALFIYRYALNRLAGTTSDRSRYATLCIYDGMPFEDGQQYTRIKAEDYGLSADASDPDMIARLSKLSHDFDHLVVHCEPELRDTWAFVLKSLSAPSEIAMPELNTLNPLAVNRRASGISLSINSGPLMLHQRFLKRSFDLVAVLAAMPILAPLFIAVAIAIKLDSKGPVFFKQDRIGLDNRPFKIYKFRSMRTDLLDQAGEQSTQRSDPRITRLGAFIRRTSLDELPQLINVLRGDMSIVGPRPHARLSRAGDLLFWEVDNAYWHRHTVKPGITGLAQIRGHRGNTFHEDHLRVRLDSDLEYVANWSLWKDLIIVLMTFKVLSHQNAF